MVRALIGKIRRKTRHLYWQRLEIREAVVRCLPETGNEDLADNGEETLLQKVRDRKLDVILSRFSTAIDSLNLIRQLLGLQSFSTSLTKLETHCSSQISLYLWLYVLEQPECERPFSITRKNRSMRFFLINISGSASVRQRSTSPNSSCFVLCSFMCHYMISTSTEPFLLSVMIWSSYLWPGPFYHESPTISSTS